MEQGAQAAESGLRTLFGYPLDVNVVISCLTVSVVLTIIALMLGRTKVVPTGLQALLEHVWQWLEGLSISLMGPIGKRYVPFCMAIFLYILIANWIGLIPNFIEWFVQFTPVTSSAHTVLESASKMLEPATTSANVTLAMALISFGSFMILGIHRSIERATAPAEHHGHGHHEPTGVGGGFVNWISHYIQPVPSLWNSMEGAMKYGLVPLLLVLFVFLNIIEEVARVLSLTFRLFGNMFGEHQVKTKLVMIIGMFSGQAMAGLSAGAAGILPFLGYGVLTLVLWGTVLFVVCLGTLAGFIQAFVFTLLTMSYISHAVADSH